MEGGKGGGALSGRYLQTRILINYVVTQGTCDTHEDRQKYGRTIIDPGKLDETGWSPSMDKLGW